MLIRVTNALSATRECRGLMARHQTGEIGAGAAPGRKVGADDEIHQLRVQPPAVASWMTLIPLSSTSRATMHHDRVCLLHEWHAGM
jgi:hypothetical protein